MVGTQTLKIASNQIHIVEVCDDTGILSAQVSYYCSILLKTFCTVAPFLDHFTNVLRSIFIMFLIFNVYLVFNILHFVIFNQKSIVSTHSTFF